MTTCDHVWMEGEDWEHDGETEWRVIVYECEKCFARLTPIVVNEQLNALRAERDTATMALQQIRDLLYPLVGYRTIAEVADVIHHSGDWPIGSCFIFAEQALANQTGEAHDSPR